MISENEIKDKTVSTNCMKSNCPYIVVLGDETHHYGCKIGHENAEFCKDSGVYKKPNSKDIDMMIEIMDKTNPWDCGNWKNYYEIVSRKILSKLKEKYQI